MHVYQACREGGLRGFGRTLFQAKNYTMLHINHILYLLLVSSLLTPQTIEEPRSLSMQFRCCSSQYNMNGMIQTHVFASGYITLAWSPIDSVKITPILYVWEVWSYYCSTGHIFDAKLSPGPFLGFQQRTFYSLSFMWRGSPLTHPPLSHCMPTGYHEPSFWNPSSGLHIVYYEELPASYPRSQP